jgi:DNA-binding Xre family transcriptional regulator
MVIKVNIHGVAISRGVKTAYQLQKAANLTPTNASKLFNNEIAQISINTLGKLCDALDCSPADLLLLRKKSDRRRENG